MDWYTIGNLMIVGGLAITDYGVSMHYFTEKYKCKTGVGLDTWNPIKVIKAYRNL